ncbi:MAG TPA: glycosyltransferase family 4 protein [Vicinamibacterales bacterium]|jgi:glycosyltransferase involved in cell wall biosynthesis|nr:glycosyltransferase family 4 protein [Vicinamibacterales bacterium]
MRILYAALDQQVPGTLGGSVHVRAVAEGLAALGHEVHVAVAQGGPWPAGSVHWHAMRPPLGRPELRWMRAGAVADLARQVGADVVMERYYNFGGEGVAAARQLGVPSVLEVNAPVIDYPGSTKSRLDRALLVEPMRRWRDSLCRQAALLVTPNAQILPSWLDRAKVLEAEWGADVDSFRPDVTGPLPFTRDPARVLCVFAGAFRSWHGVAQMAASLARLHRQGEDRLGAVFIGDGPERAAAEQLTRDVPGVTFTGAVPHDQLPQCLAAADIGVAPFDPGKHKPLALGFYWSPLKIFEYMSAGLPVVAPRLSRIAALVSDGDEGLLYDPADPRTLDDALVRLTDTELRERLGGAARVRAVAQYSWRAHCALLDTRLRALVAARSGTRT